MPWSQRQTELREGQDLSKGGWQRLSPQPWLLFSQGPGSGLEPLLSPKWGWVSPPGLRILSFEIISWAGRCHPNTEEVEAGGSGVQGWPGQHDTPAQKTNFLCWEDAQWLRVLTALAEDSSLVPSTHSKWLTTSAYQYPLHALYIIVK